MKNHIFLQARLNSKRFPGKILKQICGKTILELIFERLKKIENIDKIILVTGTEDSNKSLIKEAIRLNLEYFCGSEENILDRMYNASKKFDSQTIIRVTGDNPLIDIILINKALKIFYEKKCDILSIDRIPSYPYGLNFEIFTNQVLESEWKENRKNFDTYEEFYHTFTSPEKSMLEKPIFRNYDLVNSKNLSSIRLTLDYPEDFTLISKIYEILYLQNKTFGLDEILKLLEEKPDLQKINQKYVGEDN